MWSFGCIFAEWLQLGEPLMQGSSELDQINTIFRTLGTPSDSSWPAFVGLHAIENGLVPHVEEWTMSLGADGSLVRLPKSSLRKKLPPEGYTPQQPTPSGSSSVYRTTALSDAGYELLCSLLCCDPAQRRTAADALISPWFAEEPTPAPLTRGEIRMLRRGRDEAINSGAHLQSLAAQRAETAAKVARQQGAAIAANIKERLSGAGVSFGGVGR